MIKQRIFVVEDDPKILGWVVAHLEADGYNPSAFSSSAAALEQLGRSAADMVILAFSIPEYNGIQLVRRIREMSEVPIMMISLKTDVATKLGALDLGADDYVTKPFGMAELLARVRAILRRSTNPQPSSGTLLYHWDDLEVDLDRSEVVRAGKRVRLSAREWEVLRIFVKNAGRVVTHRALVQQAWRPEYGDEGDYVRTYVTRLRKKLEPYPPKSQYLLTERGIGYRMTSPEKTVVHQENGGQWHSTPQVGLGIGRRPSSAGDVEDEQRWSWSIPARP